MPLEKGLLSRDGWALVDDSERPLFDASPWPWVVQRAPGERQDWYFFGYGHDYRRALADFTRVAGKIPMPPRFAFGAWWSRYWAYTDAELERLVGDFHRNDVPLDVLVVDMDWHNTFELRWQGQPLDQAGQRLGWTGYTWDRAYFPDPEAFLGWVHGAGAAHHDEPAPGLRHPAARGAVSGDGARHGDRSGHEAVRAVPDRGQALRRGVLRQRDPPARTAGRGLLVARLAAWGTTSIPGLNPTWWLNYVFFTDMEREGLHRPLIFHRWGGLGNHRYQIGFSGDMHSTWPALAFETYFTATAANVGFGYWSHDIGGHIPGPVAPELYTRWIQFGIFSPILRTHTTKNAAPSAASGRIRRRTRMRCATRSSSATR